MTRDFSEKAKQKLEGYADDAAASSTWGKIKDWFSDRGMDFQSWTGKLGIENYINDVDTYHQKIIDKNNATKKKIDTIFSNVQSVDTKSMAAMNRQITCGNNIIKLPIKNLLRIAKSVDLLRINFLLTSLYHLSAVISMSSLVAKSELNFSKKSCIDSFDIKNCSSFCLVIKIV